MERACFARQTALIQFIINHGGRKNMWYNNRSLIDYGLKGAAEGGHIDWVRYFLLRTRYARDIAPAFQVACEAGHWTMAQELLPHLPAAYDCSRAFCGAVRNGHLTVVENLLRRNVPIPVDSTNFQFRMIISEHHQPLDAMIAAHGNGDVALIALLRTHGAAYVHHPLAYFHSACTGSWEAVEVVMNHFEAEIEDWAGAMDTAVYALIHLHKPLDRITKIIAELVKRGAPWPGKRRLEGHHVAALLNAGVPLAWFPIRLARRIVAHREHCVDWLAQHLPLYAALRHLVDVYAGYVVPPSGPIPRSSDAPPLRRSKRLRVE